MADDDSKANSWEQFLHEAKREESGGTVPKSVLFVVGNPQNGKSSILNNWKHRVTSDTSIPEYLLDFSYCNVIDRFDPDAAEDTLVSRMGIWQLDDEAHANLLPTLTKDPSRVAFVITLDLSQPWNLMESLEKWLKVYRETCIGLIESGSKLEGQLQLKISKYVQTFVDATKKRRKTEIKIVEQKYDPTAEVTDETRDETPGDEEIKDDVLIEEEINLDAPVDPEIPINNYGIPLFIVGTKADYFEKMDTMGADQKFDFVTTRLRKKCLEWGATLIYTSATGEGVNIEVFIDQIYHRLFGFQLLHKPKVVGSAADYTIHVPAGYDSATLLDLARKSKWDDSTHLSIVFDHDEGKKHNRAASRSKKVVSARPDDEFFRSLKKQLESGKPREDPKKKKRKKNKQREKQVAEFFSTLLTQTNSLS